MALYTTLPEIKKQMERSKVNLWWLTDSDGVLIAESEDKLKTIEDAFRELEDFVSAADGDFCIITLRNKVPNVDENGNGRRGGDNRSITKFVFRVRLKNSTGGTSSGTNREDVTGLAGLYTMIGDMKAQLVETKAAAEIAGLKKELEEAKKSKSGSYTETLIEHVAKEFVKEWTGKKPTGKIGEEVSSAEFTYEKKSEATTQPQSPEATEEQRKTTIKDSLGAISGVMGDKTYKLLETLKDMAKNNPEQFKAQANMIIESNDEN